MCPPQKTNSSKVNSRINKNYMCFFLYLALQDTCHHQMSLTKMESLSLLQKLHSCPELLHGYTGDI